MAERIGALFLFIRSSRLDFGCLAGGNAER